MQEVFPAGGEPPITDVCHEGLSGVEGTNAKPSRDVKNKEFTPLVADRNGDGWRRVQWPPEMIVVPILDTGWWRPVSFVAYTLGIPYHDEHGEAGWGLPEE